MALGIAVVIALAPSTASAQPLTCGQTITRDTTLHSDLGPCPGDGLVIGADNVTLDLNGHVIIGNATGEDVGVRDEGYDGVVVENGGIRGFATAIKLDAADQSRVSGITVRARRDSCVVAVEIQRSTGARVEDNVAVFPGFGDSCRAFVVSGSYNSIENNVARGQVSEGLGFDISGPHNTISDNANRGLGGMAVRGFRNRITNNYIEEFELGGGPFVSGARNFIARNTTTTNEVGLVADGPGNVVRKNVLGDAPSASVNQSLFLGGDCRNARVEANVVQNGIVLSGCQAARVVDNSLPASGIEGIRLDGGSGNLIERNTLSRIEETGIWVAGGSDNSVAQNTISDTDLSGIFVGTCCGRSDPASVGTVVEGNLVLRAGFGCCGDQKNDGIHVDDPGTVIADNGANDNADYGIQAVPGVIDGGGNTASGNGNPLQCLNVVCN